MSSEEARSQALRALSSFLVTQKSVGDTLLRVSEITTNALPAADMAGITMLAEDGKPKTSVFTDPQAPVIDKAQYESGRGPCLDSWRRTAVIRLDDLKAAADRYPEFVEAAAAHGVQSTLSLPLVAGGEGVGALNLYSRVPAGFSEEDEQLGQELAATAAVVLVNATAYWEALQLGEQLTEAMRSRAVIEQAKGILMARSPHLTADDAFDLLRHASQRENVKLRDIAQRIVDRRPASRGETQQH
jgi:GAF domain-containing protein